MVILTEDQSQVAAVTYWQHAGWYTRLANGADSDRFFPTTSYDPGLEFNGDHPIVYVGKTQHGSFHDEGGYIDFPIFNWPECLYFGDFRNNEGRTDLRLDTQHNLKSLADFEELWMKEEKPEIGISLGVGDGTKTAFDLGSKFVISESISITVSGTTSYQHAWSFSDGTGTNGEDQVVFDVAPAAGAQITADLKKGDWKWGCFQNEDRNECGVSGHGPVNVEELATWKSCEGLDPTYFGETRGCFESQCQWHDDEFGPLPTELGRALPGMCSHCPSGYTDMGLYCGKGKWPWEWRTTKKHYYWLQYTIPRADNGLTKKSW